MTQKWPAYKLWNDEYLNEKFGNTTMHMETKDDDKINLPGDQKFSEFLKVYKESNSNLYLVDEVNLIRLGRPYAIYSFFICQT